MADRVHRVGRLELWCARLSARRERLSGWRERLRRSSVWGPLLAGPALLIGIGWWYASNTAFARRAVLTTTAVIQQVFPPPGSNTKMARPTWWSTASCATRSTAAPSKHRHGWRSAPRVPA